MEGPMRIDNVSVVGNSFPGTTDGNDNIHPSSQATNITISANYPRRSAPTPNNRTAFCTLGRVQPCKDALAGATSDFKCSADFEHVEQHMLPPKTIYVDALHVDARGNGHTDVAVRGVMYTDENGQPGQLIATTEVVTVKADALRSFVRLPFQLKGGISIISHEDGQTVWIGEQAGKPQQPNGRTAGAGNGVLPPGPLDLACFGFAPSAEHRACAYTPQPFAANPKQLFRPASVCSSSLSIFATTVAAGMRSYSVPADR